MTEDMSRAKAVCVFCGGDIVRCGNGWSHTAMHDNRYNHEGTPDLPAASRLPAEPKVEPKEAAPEAAGPSEEYLRSDCEGCSNLACPCNAGSYEGAEAVAYSDGFITGREAGYHSCGSCEHPWDAHDGECGAYMPDGSICGCQRIILPSKPEPATEGAPETACEDECTFPDCTCPGKRFTLFRGELKAEGAEKAPKRPEWHTITEDGDSENVYPEDAATAYMDALESRNDELRKEAESALAEVESLRETLANRNKLMHGKFGFVPSPTDPKKCGCAYCTRDTDALADHAAEMEMELYLPGGWRERADKAEAELAQIKQRETPESAWKRGYLLGLHYTGSKHPEPCAPPYQTPGDEK